MAEQFHTIDEIAKMLKVHRNTVVGWIDRDELEAIQFEREYRIAQSALEAFLKNRSTRQRSKRTGGGKDG